MSLNVTLQQISNEVSRFLEMQLEKAFQNGASDRAIAALFVAAGKTALLFTLDAIRNAQSCQERGGASPRPLLCCFNLDCSKAEEALRKCSRCKQAVYCSTDCQAADWPKHKLICRILEDALNI